MSIIIIRHKGAKEIDESVLKAYLSQADGWGIVSFPYGKTSYTRSETVANFISSFRKREKEDLKMVIHINEFFSGTECRQNLQPVCISKEMGIAALNGYIIKAPESVSNFFDDSKVEKSDEISAELRRFDNITIKCCYSHLFRYTDGL